MKLFTIAAEGAQAAQNQLSVAAGHIANQQTEGYSRQQITQSASVVSGVGSGVNSSDPQRITDQSVNQALWHSQTASGYYTSMNSWGTSLEQVISTSTSQPSGLLTNFFNSLSALTSEPDSSAYRQQLLTSATTLATGLSQTSQTLADQKSSVISQQNATTDQINQLTSQIAALNQQIQRTGSEALAGFDADAMPVQVVTRGDLPGQRDAVTSIGLGAQCEGLVHWQQVCLGNRLRRWRGQQQRQGDEQGRDQYGAAGDPAGQGLHERQDSLRVSARTQSR